jgi:hypothetical protein
MTTATANTAAAAAATAIAERLMAAESAVADATIQRDLTRAIAEQAQTIAEEAAQRCAQAHESLAEARHMRATAINPVGVATTNKVVEVMEVTANEMERNATTKGNIAYDASALTERARDNYYAAINALNSLHERGSDNGGSETGNSASIGTQGMTATPHLTLTLSTTPTTAAATRTP